MISLLVIHTARLEECRDFYAGLGLPFVREQHGSGPVHYAAELPGLVLELYPARPERATGRLRLGLVSPALPAGEHTLTDPAGPSSSQGPVHDVQADQPGGRVPEGLGDGREDREPE